jgi:hypothetical protein
MRTLDVQVGTGVFSVLGTRSGRSGNVVGGAGNTPAKQDVLYLVAEVLSLQSTFSTVINAINDAPHHWM